MGTWTAEEQREHRKLWVEALRSGKYQQAQGELLDANGGMCCLGVACEISGLGTWHNHSYDTPDFSHFGELEPNSDMTAWLGLASSCGLFDSGAKSLAELNDNGQSFAEIANVIESEPEGLLATKASS